jgi:hypothetical protein
MAQSSGGTTPNTPEDDQARLARMEAMQRALTWSGSDPNATNSSETGATTFDMNALRSQAGALGRAADAANAARNGDVGISSVTTQPTGAQYMPGSEPTPYTPPAIPSQSVPQQIATNGSIGTAASSGAATGGTLSTVLNPPKLTGPTTTATPTGGINAGTLAGAMTTGIDKGPGAGAITTVPGAGGPAGPSGAGSGTVDQSGGLGALTSSIVSALQSAGQSALAPGSSPDVGAVYMQQAQSILAMLDEQEKQLRADSERQGTTLDPSVAFTLNTLRQTLEDNLKTTREDLNRRGVYDSGITLDLESKLRKGSASDAAMVMASRLSKLQDQLSQGLAGIRSQKVSTLSSFGRDAANAQTSSDEASRRRQYDTEQNAIKSMLDLRGQVSTENNQAANRSFQGNESALQRAYGESQSKAQTAAQFEQNRLAYEREKSLVDQRAAAGAYTSGGTSTKSTALSRAAGGDVTQQAIADLKSVFTNSDEASAAIKQQMAELAANGVDIAALFNAANGLGGRRVGTTSY